MTKSAAGNYRIMFTPKWGAAVRDAWEILSREGVMPTDDGVRETHVLPGGMELETTWFPNGRVHGENGVVDWELTWPALEQLSDVSCCDIVVTCGSNECHNGDDARDYIRALVHRFETLLGGKL